MCKLIQVKIGQKFGRWTVVGKTHHGKNIYYTCKCECGTVKDVWNHNLFSGRSTGCNKCKRPNHVTHNETNTVLYRRWRAMKKRCHNQNDTYYRCYGGRGIAVCDEWLEYESFSKWAKASGFRENLTLERIDVNGDYCPENCTWIPMQDQAKNKRNTKYGILFGEKVSAKEISKRLGIPYTTVIYHINRGHMFPTKKGDTK